MPAVIDGTNNSTFPGVDGVTMLQGSVAMPRMVLSTAQNTTSGTSIDFTSIPSWAKRITVMFNGVSTNGTSNLQVQLGSGSVDATGYTSRASSVSTSVTSTAGFLFTVAMATAADTNFGLMHINLLGSNSWAYSSICNDVGQNGVNMAAGVKTLSGTLDRLRLTTVGGTDTFDAGSVNILYEG